MHGDFSLNPLAYRHRVSRVLSQQGRVQLDSDANEQTETVLRAVHGLAADLIGAHGGLGDSFEVFAPDPAKPAELAIRSGVYYVDGLRCVNFPVGFEPFGFFDIPPAPFSALTGTPYKDQPDYYPLDDWNKVDGSDAVLFYLDVFERHVAAAQDDTLREVALLGPDTCSRAVLVWQLRAMPAQGVRVALAEVLKQPPQSKLPPSWDAPYLALNLLLRSGVRMRAQAKPTETTEPCTISPDARFRGAENRLYRVEIHDVGGEKSKPSFKWSEDNGSIVYPIRKIEGSTVHLDSLGRDDRTTLRVNDWVEVVDDKVFLMGIANPLLQVVDVRPHAVTVTLSAPPQDGAGDPKLRPILRRWAGAPVSITEAAKVDEAWTPLSEGIEVQFSFQAPPKAHYRTGDYWLIPARTALGDVLWPHDGKVPRAVTAHGIDHHYAPLALVMVQDNTNVTSYRRSFASLSKAVK